MTRLARATRFVGLPLVWGMVVVLLVAPIEAAGLSAADGDVDEVRVHETVEARLDAHGVPDRATLHTRLEASGRGTVEIVDPVASPEISTRGWDRRPEIVADAAVWRLDLDEPQVRETTSPYPVDDVPLGLRIRYELDGEPVSPEDLDGATGEAVVRLQLRNPTEQGRPILVDDDGDRRLETVPLALPLLAEATVELDERWRTVDADHGRVSAGTDGGTQVRWSASLFEPLGATTAELEIRGDLDGGALPAVRVDATPVDAASSDLIAAADDLLTERATLDAVAAFLASVLAEALEGASDGARGIADGLAELEEGLGDAATEFDDVDPETLAEDALAGLADDLDPSALLGQLMGPDLFDPARLLDDLDGAIDPEELLAEIDLASALEDIDAAALLEGADVAAMVEELLAQLDPSLAPVEVPSDTLERSLQEALEGLDVGATLGDVLAELDLAALFDDLELDLDDVDWSELLAAVDLAELLEDADLDALVQRLVEDLEPVEIDPSTLEAFIRDFAEGRTVGDLIDETGLEDVIAVLLAEVDLEIEIAALVAGALDELDIDLPTVDAERLEHLSEKLEATLGLATSSVAAAAELTDRLEQAEDDLPGAIEEAPNEELAALAGGLADEVRAAAALLDGVGDDALNRVEQRLDEAVAELDAAIELVEELEGDEERIAQLLERLERTRARIDEARDGVGDVRAELAAGLAEARGAIEAVADELDDLAALLADGEALVELVDEGVLTPVLEAAGEVETRLAAVESGLDEAVRAVADLAEEIDEDTDVGDLLVAALEGKTVDLAPFVAEGAERLLAEIADVPLDDVLDELPLSEILGALDLEFDPAELLAGIDLDELLAGIDLDDLVELGALDTDTVFDGVPVSDFLATLDPDDLAVLLDDLGIDPAALLADLDLAALLADADLADLIGDLLGDIDFAELAELLADADLDLEAVLEAGGVSLDDLFAEVEFPELRDILGEDALERLFAELAPEPDTLLADLDLPGVEALLAELDLDMSDVLAELGLEDLGDLDEMIDGLLEALAALAGGSGELADGLDELGAEGLGQLIQQLDDDAQQAQRDMQMLAALGDRALDAQPTAAPDGAIVGARYELVSEPREPLPVGVIALAAALIVLAGVGELARRRLARR